MCTLQADHAGTEDPQDGAEALPTDATPTTAPRLGAKSRKGDLDGQADGAPALVQLMGVAGQTPNEEHASPHPHILPVEEHGRRQEAVDEPDALLSSSSDEEEVLLGGGCAQDQVLAAQSEDIYQYRLSFTCRTSTCNVLGR